MPLYCYPLLDACDDPVYNYGPDAGHPKPGKDRCPSTSTTVLTAKPKRKPCAPSARLMTLINADSARVGTLHELYPCVLLSAGTEMAHRHPFPAQAAAVPLVLVETALPAGTRRTFPLAHNTIVCWPHRQRASLLSAHRRLRDIPGPRPTHRKPTCTLACTLLERTKSDQKHLAYPFSRCPGQPTDLSYSNHALRAIISSRRNPQFRAKIAEGVARPQTVPWEHGPIARSAPNRRFLDFQ